MLLSISLYLFAVFLWTRSSAEISRGYCDQFTKLGTKFGVDKFDGSFHNYHNLYCELLSPLKRIVHTNFTMLEIGFGCGHHVQGASALLWMEYFKQKIQYYAIDYPPKPDCWTTFVKKNPEHRVQHLWFGDQNNATFLRSVIAEYGPNKTFDVIIDDGGHLSQQIITTFIELWPHVSHGGYYIVEDLALEGGKFVATVNKWMFQLGTGAYTATNKDKTRTGDPYADFDKVVPYHAVMMGCSFQICYVKKASSAIEQGGSLPMIWGQ